ncbi:hypothetical protein ACFL34_05085, partial [Candidatus Sumerlaeota bacterium]
VWATMIRFREILRGWRSSPLLYHWLALAAIIVIVMVAVVATFRPEPAPLFRVTGDGLPIRLLGVCPDGGDELFDGEGRPSGEWRNWAAEPRTWNLDQMRRDFVFEIPATSETIHFLSPQITMSDAEEDSPWRMTVSDPKFALMANAPGDGTTRTIPLSVALQRTYRERVGFPVNMLPSAGERDTTHVDITLRYYQGPRGKPECSFSGPFKLGATLADAQNPAYTLSVQGRKSGSRDFGSLLTLDASLRLQMGGTLIVYDKQGQWHFAEARGGSFGSGTSRAEFHVKLFPEEIARVTYNEKSRERVFHSVAVTYPDRPRRTYPANIDEIAKRLELPSGDPEAVRAYQFKSPQEALKVIELTRGYKIYGAGQAIRSGKPKLKPEDLDEQQRQKLRRVANWWLASSETSMRASAVELGLWAKWPEFIQPALELVEAYHRGADQVPYALQRASAILELEHLAQIKDLLLRRGDPRTDDRLWRCLTSQYAREGMAEILRELAESDKPWLWLPVVRDSRVLDELKKAGPLSDRIVLRQRAMGWAPGDSDENPPTSATQALLKSILTPKFAQMNSSDFRMVLERMVKTCEPEEATAALAGFLAQLLDEWHKHDVEGYSWSRSQTVDRAVKHLNRLNEVNIGELGSDVSRPTPNERGHDWRVIAKQAVLWAEGGADPSQLPAGWQAGREDLRIVWRNLVNPELSVIRVWSQHPTTETLPASFKLVDDFVTIALEPFSDPVAGTGYTAKLGVGVVNDHSSNREVTLNGRELPTQIDLTEIELGTGRDSEGVERKISLWNGKWELWLERAVAPESVLGETKLFADWKKTYLAGAPLTETRPKAFFRHPRAAVRQYVLDRRPCEGWTELELALRWAMDQDKGMSTEDLRDLQGDLTWEDAIKAWREFLERDDVTTETSIFAWAQLGRIYRRDRETRDQGLAAIEQACGIDPDYVAQVTIRAHDPFTYLPREAKAQAERIADCYEWLRTRTDEMIERSARRPSVCRYGGFSSYVPIRYGSKLTDESLQRDLEALRRSLRSARKRLEDQLPRRLKALREEDPKAAEYLSERLRKFDDLPAEVKAGLTAP